MPAAALADYLTDFAPPRARTAQPYSPVLAAVPDIVPEPSQPDIDSIVAEAVGRAEADLSARLEALHEARLQAEREAHEAELNELRGKFGAEFGARIASTLAGLEQETVRIATSATARILGQIMSDALCERAVADLANTIHAAIGDADTIRVRVRGPQSLFMPLTVAMGAQARHLEFVETQAADLTVSIDETLFETRLAEWSKFLTEIIT